MDKSTRELRSSWLWTPREDEVIRANSPQLSYRELADILPGRTRVAVRERSYFLGMPLRGTFPPVTRRALNETYFSDLSLQSAYWAGFIAADGCVVRKPRRELRIGIHQRDTNQVERFVSDVGFDGAIAFRNRMCYVTICAADRWLADLELSYNIGPQKTMDLQPPNVSGVLALAYSIGYIDGDGCWAIQNRKHNTKMLVVVGTAPLLEWLKRLWVEHGATVGNTKISFKRNVWRLSITGSHAESIVRLLGNVPVARMERKWRVARGETFGQEKS